RQRVTHSRPVNVIVLHPHILLSVKAEAPAENRGLLDSGVRPEPDLAKLTASQDASPPAYATDHQSLYASTASQHSPHSPSSDDDETHTTSATPATNDPQDHPNDHTRTGQDSHTDHHQAKSPDTYTRLARTQPHESAPNSTAGPPTATTPDDKPRSTPKRR